MRPVWVRVEAQDNPVPQQRVDETAAVEERRPEKWRGPKRQSLQLPVQVPQTLSAL